MLMKKIEDKKNLQEEQARRTDEKLIEDTITNLQKGVERMTKLVEREMHQR